MVVALSVLMKTSIITYRCPRDPHMRPSRRGKGIQVRADMHTVFERFLEQMSESVDEADLHRAMAGLTEGLDLMYFACLSWPMGPNGKPTLISNYPAPWTARYLENRYQNVDPVIARARCGGYPFQWGFDLKSFGPSEPQRRVSKKRRSLASAAA